MHREWYMPLNLEARVVFVTGSARRVGRAIAMAFADQGANLVIHHASPGSADQARSAVEEIASQGLDAIVVRGDQSDPEEVARIFEEIRDHYGRLDVMVNSAAILKRTELLDVTYEEWKRVLDVNLTGPFLLTQHAARLMIETDTAGVIINISDNSGLNPWPAYPHAGVSKAGLVMLTKVASLALAPHDIRVNCVVPGPVLAPPDKERVFERIVEQLPLGRAGSPADVGHACVFLAQNDFATGTILRVDGGEGIACGRV
jgi:NAD(P)-dependent dehydrogenase (short-subunit alcohol dehydrogenase family)